MALVYDPGLALFLFPEQLLHFGATHTLAENEAVTAEHWFLCLSADAREGLWTPLHATRGQDRLPIAETAKTGQSRWTQGYSWYSTRDLWRIPHKAIQRASPPTADRGPARAPNRVVAAFVPSVAAFAAADANAAH
jgi:hypothetical protein